jgi:hypothetical protein
VLKYVPKYAAIALLALGMLRMLIFVSNEPIFAYANQYDQARVSDCINRWPVIDGRIVSDASPHAPNQFFERKNLGGQQCQRNTTSLLTAILFSITDTSFFNKSVGVIDIRALGMFCAVCVCGVGILWHGSLEGNGKAQLAHSFAFLFILADPMTLLFFNTLYTETVAVIASYAAAYLLVRDPKGTSWPLAILFVTTFICLAFSRTANMVVPVCFSSAWAWKNRDISAARRWVPLGFAILLATGSLWSTKDQGAVTFANRTNAIMQALAPNASDPISFLRRLNLPIRCDVLVGSSWYLTAGADPAVVCPELQNVSIIRLAIEAISQPRTLAMTMYRGLLRFGAPRLTYLGEVGGESFKRVGAVSPWLDLSLDSLWLVAPVPIRALFFLFPALWAVTIVSARLVNKSTINHTQTFVVVCALIVTSGWFIAVIGDGFSELSRHLHLAILSAYVTWGALLVTIFASPRKIYLMPLVIALAATVGCAAWVAYLPISTSAIDRVESVGDRTTISGWTLSTHALNSIEVTSLADEAKHSAKIRVAPDVQQVFALSSRQVKRFSVDITGPERGGCTRLRLMVGLDVDEINQDVFNVCRAK